MDHMLLRYTSIRQQCKGGEKKREKYGREAEGGAVEHRAPREKGTRSSTAPATALPEQRLGMRVTALQLLGVPHRVSSHCCKLLHWVTDGPTQ